MPTVAWRSSYAVSSVQAIRSESMRSLRNMPSRSALRLGISVPGGRFRYWGRSFRERTVVERTCLGWGKPLVVSRQRACFGLLRREGRFQFGHSFSVRWESLKGNAPRRSDAPALRRQQLRQFSTDFRTESARNCPTDKPPSGCRWNHVSKTRLT